MDEINLQNFRKELRAAGDPKKAVFLQRFFKTGKGEYAAGDIFLGLTVPQSRRLARRYAGLPFPALQKMISSKFHEERLIALLILVERFAKAEEKSRKQILDFYQKNLRYVNNWDLVDLSAHKILGEHLLRRPKKLLRQLARSQNLWERRVAMIATFQFIRHDDFQPTLQIARMLLHDPHDLIHKAVGWMLREVGKRDEQVLKKFLHEHAPVMPRTMLRYAIERFSQKVRRSYLRL